MSRFVNCAVPVLEQYGGHWLMCSRGCVRLFYGSAKCDVCRWQKGLSARDQLWMRADALSIQDRLCVRTEAAGVDARRSVATAKARASGACEAMCCRQGIVFRYGARSVGTPEQLMAARATSGGRRLEEVAACEMTAGDFIVRLHPACCSQEMRPRCGF